MCIRDRPNQNNTSSTLEFSQLIKSLLILPAFALIQGIVFFISKYMTEWVGSKIVTDLRASLFNHIHSLPLQFFTHNKVGQLISRISNDTTALNQIATNVLADAVRAPFTLIGSIAVLMWIDWKLSLISLLIFPICIFPIIVISRKIRKAAKINQESIGDLLSISQESITGALVVKAFQTEKDEINQFKIYNQSIFRMTMKQVRGMSLSEPLMTFVSSLGITAVILYMYTAQLPISLLAAFTVALANMYKPIKKLSLLHMKINKSLPSISRIFEVLDEKNTILDTPNSIQLSSDINSIQFINTCFSYNNEKTVLNNISFTAKKGESIALVGSSGSGKTTLVNLIPRLYDYSSGEILINNKNLKNYNISSLRKQIGIVTQKTILFNKSINDNIKYGSFNASDEEVQNASIKANAHNFIKELENGYKTIIGEQGSTLSGGMAQRIAIARALLRNPPILILDEATSALDNESEKLVQDALNTLMFNRTVFIIAHRLSTIKNADKILVLDKGIIIESGKHDDLLASSNHYKYLYDLQFKSD